MDPNLPSDLVAYLQRGTQPQYDPASCEAGTVTFLPADKLKVEFFPMTSERPDDPHAGENGSYLVAGVSLLASCDDYEPVGLLLWLPLDARYGTWDGEHGSLRVFSKTTRWSTIAKNLPRYINSQWELEGSAPVSDLTPWGRHSYNAEQLYQPLPDISEWYEAKWVRRGVNRNGVQLRYPEELQIRIERDGKRCEVTIRTKKPEKGAELSSPASISLASDALEQIRPHLERGFWNQPQSAERLGGEAATYWFISGYREFKYHSVRRFYDEDGHKRDPVHVLGKELARMAGLRRFLAKDN